jgi:hypothetical protein
LIVRNKSRRPDRLIANIEEDLRDGLHQLSGERPGIIVCYVPEVSSFDGVNRAGTATWSMVQRIFSRPDAQNLACVCLLSDPAVTTRPGATETGVPSVKFVSNTFRETPLEIL